VWRRSQSSAFRCAHVCCGFYVDRVSIFLFQISPGSLSVLSVSQLLGKTLRRYALEVPLPGEWSLLSLSCHVSARLVFVYSPRSNPPLPEGRLDFLKRPRSNPPPPAQS
jgi:hypothetical protein